MSLIESALEKLRRVGEPEPDRVAGARTVVAATPAKAAPVVLPPPREYQLKRIVLNVGAMRAAGYLPEEGLERRFADHYRHIKRPLIDRAVSGPADMRLILVSSALPGDGKTFTSINLAMSMARERDVSVLLVDADAPKRRVSDVFGLRSDLGLLDALMDESVDVESLVVQTDIRGLEILPAGKLVESAPELLASSRMDQIATRLAARNSKQLILFDSAPLLVSSEARALLRVPGQVVLVVRCNVTPRQAALDAAAYVDKRKLQGLIVNHAPFAPVGGYYGYGGYGESTEQSSDGH